MLTKIPKIFRPIWVTYLEMEVDENTINFNIISDNLSNLEMGVDENTKDIQANSGNIINLDIRVEKTL